ncbi:MAG: glycosyltransferase [Lachnospiraceae bacterium]|nr:glycosyltransferase [Lachnospiraceae bacterium]
MKKGYYIHFQGRQSIGVSKKIDMQMEELGKFYEMQEIAVETPVRSLAWRVLGLFPVASITRDYKAALEQMDDPDFLYVRRTVADREYLHFWKQVKERYPNCRILIELFTYPYDKDDFGKWNAWPFYLKELLYRPRLKKYVDRFVTYTDDKEIFGIPTIRSANGINVDSVPQIAGAFQDGQINMIGVAFMQRHHGYERIIEGMREYYDGGQTPELKIRLRLVGDGPEKPMYQELVEKYHLEEYVQFYPTMSGKELDELYDDSDLALVSFGMYKAGFYGKLGALKSRECLAKGMPLITGCEIDVLPEDYPFAKVFPNDGSTVNMEEIAALYRRIRHIVADKKELADRIREYAKEHVSMAAVMKPVVTYIEMPQRNGTGAEGENAARNDGKTDGEG